ncbi:hypothetical protein BTZ20_3331 [Rhodococcus sp. MTM3W5.2]|nr:hypothetical protein BTZ20_3331 [Rhodococcus sp. MTM3W5.2]
MFSILSRKPRKSKPARVGNRMADPAQTDRIHGEGARP